MTKQDEARQRKHQQLEQLRQQVAELERQLNVPKEPWQATGFYAAYHATTGLVLGIAGALASLLFNIVGSLIVGQHPLRLIQVYLTFPLGEQALTEDFHSGISLVVGCCLYIGTGMLLGIPFQMLTARYLPSGTMIQRLLFASVIGIVIWIINFYAVIAWLQPLLFGGSWIVDPHLLPPWVGAATHLVFAWTMAVLYPWGTYVPYRRATDRT